MTSTPSTWLVIQVIAGWLLELLMREDISAGDHEPMAENIND